MSLGRQTLLIRALLVGTLLAMAALEWMKVGEQVGGTGPW